MIQIYCHGNHHTKGQELCSVCRELTDYCNLRTDKCPFVEVSSTKALARVLTEMNLEYLVLSETTAYIYGKVSISKLVLALAEKECELVTVKEQDESLESYYVNLVGGADFE